jgi:hypothetical protein
MTLRSQLTDLAQSFADNVIAALRGASLEELLGDRKGRSLTPAANDGEDRTAPARRAKPGRLPRRSAEDIAKSMELVSKLVKSNPKGMRAEQIRKTLGLDVREMPRILKEGLAKKKLKAKGQKRATTYFAA